MHFLDITSQVHVKEDFANKLFKFSFWRAFFASSSDVNALF